MCLMSLHVCACRYTVWCVSLQAVMWMCVQQSNTRYTQHMHNTLTSAYVVRVYAMETLSVRVCLYIGRVVGARPRLLCGVDVRVCM